MFRHWFARSVATIGDADTKHALYSAWTLLREKLNKARTPETLSDALSEGRQIMFSLAWTISGLLLALDAQRDRDAVALEVSRRWILDGEGLPGEFAFPSVLHVGLTPMRPAGRERSDWDCRIVWGVHLF